MGEACSEHDAVASMPTLLETMYDGDLKQLDHVCHSGMLTRALPSERKVLESAVSTLSGQHNLLDALSG